MKRGTIYGLSDPTTNELRYIGKTFTSPDQRLKQHLRPYALRVRTHKGAWLRRLAREGQRPSLDVIDVVDVINIDEAERFWIAYWRFIGASLVNGTDGGDGRNGQQTPLRTRIKISLACQGRTIDDVQRKKISKELHGRAPSAFVKEKLRRAQTGRRASALTKARMRRQGRGCVLIDQDGNTYASITAAAAHAKVSRTTLWKSLRGLPVFTNGLSFHRR